MPSTTGDNPPEFEYRWSTSGEHGQVTDEKYYSGDVAKTGTNITTNSDKIDFVSDGSGFGDDSVYVEVYVKDGSARNLIGHASVHIKIRDIKPTISPRKVSLWPPDVQKFSVTVPESLVMAGDELSYIWSTTGNYGGFVTGGNHYESELDVASWMVRGNWSEGNDQVTVEVMRKRDGKTESLGNATAEIIVEKNKSFIVGSWGVEESEASDFAQTGRMCAYAYIYVPKVEGAISYEMHAYDFNDPLFFGKEYNRTWSGPQGDGGGKNTAIEDMGGVWRIGLSGGCGPGNRIGETVAQLKSRFGGMVVDVKVTKGN